MSKLDPKPEWLLATLQDVQDSLNEVVEKLEKHTDVEAAQEILKYDLVHVYAKLNYAVNSACLADEALNVLSEDEVIGWPPRMPFMSLDELEERIDEDAEEE